MSLFLTEESIRHAVGQLRRSSARARLCEFLIGLRTLKLSGADQAPVAESVPEYLQAVHEFTRWTEDDTVDSPYFNPFGSQAGYKSKKFPSNGPSNTMHGWATQADSPFEIIHARPKEIRRRQLSTKQLRAFTILGKRDDERPRLIDVAVWFYRSTDFSRGEGAYDAVEVQQLAERTLDREGLESRFMDDLGLEADDAWVLFRPKEEDGPDDTPPDAPGTSGAESVQVQSGQDSDPVGAA